jgi:uncharacterized membrane protein YccC
LEPALKQLRTGSKVFPYWPRTIENRAALRTAFSVVVAVLIAFQFHFQTPYWSGMSVIIIANLYTGSILDKALMRITGTVIGALFGFYLVGLVANSFLLYLIFCFLIIAICVYFYHYSNYGYAYLLGALCAFIIICQIIINPHNALYVAIWRPVEIGLGVLVSAISVYAIFPNHLKDNLSNQVHELFNDLIHEMQQLSLCLTQTPLSFDEVAASNLKMKRKMRKAVELIGSMNRELGVTQAKTDEFRAFLDTFATLTRQIHYVISIPVTPEEALLMQALSLDQVLLALQHDLAQLHHAFADNRLSKFDLHSSQALEDLEGKIKDRMVKQPLTGDFIYSFMIFLNQLNQNIAFLQALLSKNPMQKENQPTMIGRKDRLRADNELIKHSIKAGFTVLLALGFWFLSNWPGGINGIISSLVISIRRTLFEMKNIIIHRLIGCSLGGGLALVSLALVEMTLYDFIIILFFAVWGFSWFMFKYPKYAYIGLQANIALVIALAQEGGPPVLLDPPLQRLAGVVIGIVASFIVANVLWRSDIWTMLTHYLDKISKCITFNMAQIFSASSKKSIHDLANFFWLSRGLIEALGETKLNEKKQKKLTSLRQKFESLVMTQATVSYILVAINREQAAATALLFALDLPVLEQRLVMFCDQKNQAEVMTLAQEFHRILKEIETDPLGRSMGFDELRNLLAYLNALKQLTLSLNDQLVDRVARIRSA